MKFFCDSYKNREFIYLQFLNDFRSKLLIKNKLYCNNINLLIDYVLENDSKNNVVCVVNNLNDFSKTLFMFLNLKNFKFKNSKNLKSYNYNAYIDAFNNVYYVNIRIQNKWIKIVDFEKIYNNKKLLSISEIKNICEKIIKKENIKSTASSIALLKFSKQTKYDLKSIFPILNKSQFNFIKKSFYGGLNYFNKANLQKINKKMYVYDVNSLYSFVMYKYKLPYGCPLFFSGAYRDDKLYNLYIQHIKVDYKIKKNATIILSKNNEYNINDNSELISSHGMLEDLYFTNYDLKLFFENYDINEIYYINGLKFKSTNKIFTNYIKKIYNLKQKEKEKNNKKFFKILLNGLYGKFGSKKNVSKKAPDFKNNNLKFLKVDDIKSGGGYNPVLAFVLSLARFHLYKFIKINYKNYVYCDTDSMHLTAPASGIVIDNRIGNFKEEFKNVNIKYLDKKKYIIYNKNKILKKVIVGLPEEGQNKILNVEDFEKGKNIEYYKQDYNVLTGLYEPVKYRYKL